MAKKLHVLRTLLVSLAVAAIFSGGHEISGQQPLTGRWTASVSDETDKINLYLERRSEPDGRYQSGEALSLAAPQRGISDLLGLTADQARAGGFVRFSLVREAGRIDCEGSFQNGKGSGTFIFRGNPSFLANMKTRGFDFEKHAGANHPTDPEERQFVATTLNVTTLLAHDLVASGFTNLDVNDLFKAAIFKVDSKFVREMKATGFNLGLEDLVKARIFKVDAALAAKIRDMGFSIRSFESLVQLQIFKITPEFVTDMRNEGLSDLSLENLVQLRIFNIDRDFIRQSRADDVPLEVERLVQRRIGVGRN